MDTGAIDGSYSYEMKAVYGIDPWLITLLISVPSTGSAHIMQIKLDFYTCEKVLQTQDFHWPFLHRLGCPV